MREVIKYAGCFVCGDRNEQGLKARFYFDGKKATTSVKADRRHEGYRDIYHGGLISTLLDEVMIKAVLAEGSYTVTAELTIRFLHPVRIGEELTFEGWIVDRKRRVVFTEGKATDSNGRLCATATAKYIEAGPELTEVLQTSVE